MLTSYTSSNHEGLVAVMLFTGPLLVFHGLFCWSERRLLENTPRSKIRSAAVGVVELAGKARPYQTPPFTAPVSQVSCVWWHCRVEELRSSGKTSEWVTISDQCSDAPFYIQDDTGQLLINPAGAEWRVTSDITPLNSVTRTLLTPALQRWGIDSLTLFGLGRTQRVIEEKIAVDSPLFVLGNLVSLAESPLDRDRRRRAYIEAAKRDPQKMAQADLNQDGQVDGAEWDQMRLRLSAEFDAAEASRPKDASETVMIAAPPSGPFMIANDVEKNILTSLRWSAPAAILGGLLLSGLAVQVALMLNWSPWVILAFVGAALVAKWLFKNGGFTWEWH